MQKLLKTIVLLAIFAILTTSNTLSEEDVSEKLNNISSEREERIEQDLLLNLPEISDNPNHIITFKDPTGEGVFLEINGDEFKEIGSPYTLPSLSLGRHTLVFKYTDEQETEQTIERNLTIIPRPATVNPPSVVENEIKVSGKAMSNSKVELFLSRDIHNTKIIVDVNEQGEWEHTFTENIEEGLYTVLATTRRNGYSSYYSEPVVFMVGEDKDTVIPMQEGQEKISFSFADLDLENYKNTLTIFKNNTDLLIAFGIFFILGAILSWLLMTVMYKIGQRKSKKVLQELLNKKGLPASSETSSLKDKFEKSKENSNVDVVKEEEEEEDEEDKEAKTITKKEFMEKFGEFDPDDDNGEEKDLKKKKTKKEKRDVDVSLTSKD